MSHRILVALSFVIRIVLLLGMVLLGAAFAPDDAPPPPPDNEEVIAEVVRKAQEGDEESFTLLYRWYYPQIYRHLLRMVLNHEDASDLASETFRKAWEGLPKIHEKWKFLHWLYSIATHVALDHLRRNKARPPFLEYPSDDQTAKDTVRFEDSVEEWELVKLALMQVAPKPRACLLLQLQGLSQDEVARLLGLNRKSVGTYVSMAREQFRQAYHRLANS